MTGVDRPRELLVQFTLAALVAWLIFAGFILGRYGNDAAPLYYLIRPLVIAAAISLGLGALALLAHRAALAVAALGALLIALPPVGIPVVAVLVLVNLFMRAVLRRPPLKLADAVGKLALPLALVFAAIGALGAVHLVEDAPPPMATESRPAGPNLVLVLLDGYPRADSLQEAFGYDNTPFLANLERRAFDVYPESRSERHWTELTLLTILDGSDEGVPESTDLTEEYRAIRRLLDAAPLPRMAAEAGYEYVVVDSPVGHVTFSAGRHIQHGGINTFEDWLLRTSIFGQAMRPFAPYAITDSIRAHLDASLNTIVELTEPGAGRLVLGHIMAPHLPFLYSAEGRPLAMPPYWPEASIYATPIEETGMPFEYYRDHYQGHIDAVNAKLLRLVDEMIAKDPDVVIVLFSDHGARYTTANMEEWSRSFLAARTPNRPELYGESPATDRLLCALLIAYADLTC